MHRSHSSSLKLLTEASDTYGCEEETTLKDGELAIPRLGVAIRNAILTGALTETSNLTNAILADKRVRCTIPSFSTGQRNKIGHFQSAEIIAAAKAQCQTTPCKSH